MTTDVMAAATAARPAAGGAAGSAGVLDGYAHAVMNTFGPPKRVFVRGEGCYVWDADGRRHLDLLAGLAVNALGHAHPTVLSAVTGQLATLGHVSNFFATPAQVALADRLAALTGDHDARVFFTNSGTEANEAAFKITRMTGRTRIISTEGAFHGRSMGALAITHNPKYRAPFEPLPGDVTFVPYGDAAALAAVVDETVAAVVLEPIQGENGVVVPPAGLPRPRLARSATPHGALLWIDEVQTGMGRTGSWLVTPRRGRHGRRGHAGQGPGQRLPDRRLPRHRARRAAARAGQSRQHLRRQPGRRDRGAGRDHGDRARRPARPRHRAWASTWPPRSRRWTTRWWPASAAAACCGAILLTAAGRPRGRRRRARRRLHRSTRRGPTCSGSPRR